MNTALPEQAKFHLLIGGYGDFLQSVPFLLSPEAKSSRIVVATHQRGAEAFFEGLGVNVERLFFFDSDESLARVQAELQSSSHLIPSPRFRYLDSNPFPVRHSVFSNSRKTIGIHLGGSSFSINTQLRLKLAPKNLPIAVLEGLLSENFNFLIFGSRDETQALPIPQRDNIALIAFDDIFESLSYVAQCDAFVGSDSAFKTMASMLRIPTIVWIGNYRDAVRDNLFITPYVSDGTMDIYRYQDLGKPSDVAHGVQRTRFFLQDALNPSNHRLWTTLFNSSHGPIILNLRDKGVSSDIMKTGAFESRQIGLLSDITRFLLTRQKTVTVYDVGANLGTHTIALAKVNPPRVKVRSFEVQSKIFYMLCGSVALNGLGNIQCHHVAVSDQDAASLEIHVPNYSGMHNYGGFEVEGIAKSDNQDMAKPYTERVNTLTLDSFGEFVDLLKIDVEGMEEKVLGGACGIFERSTPICFVEIFKSNINNLIQFFQSRNYVGYVTNQDMLAIPANMDLQISGLQRAF